MCFVLKSRLKVYLAALASLTACHRGVDPKCIRGKYVLFRQTYEGELCTDESLTILREAVASGYTLTVDDRNMFTLARGTSQSYLRSNADIKRVP